MRKSALKREQIHVPEMDCSEEFALIQKQLQGMPGIDGIFADYLDRVVRVQFDPSGTSIDEILQRIRQLGFRSQVAVETKPVDREKLFSGWRDYSVVMGGTLLACGAIAYFFTSARPTPWAIAATLISGLPVTIAAMRSLRGRRIDINLLMVIAAIGALVIGEYFEAATAMFLFGVSLWLEKRSFRRARRAVATLVDMLPEIAHRFAAENDAPSSLEDVSPAVLVVGDRILVRPGERMPTDGRVIDGASAVTEAHITGESVPREKTTDAQVYAGSQNGDGSLVIRVTATAAESAPAQIAQLVQESRMRQSPTERFVNQFARYYTPAILVLAMMIGLLIPLGLQSFGDGNSNDFTTWLHRGLVLLVIACPCALVISTPITLVCGLHRATSLGVLVKSGEHLEDLAKTHHVALDKTGTLTLAELAVTEVRCHHSFSEDDVLACAAALEQHSEHPLAVAIVKAARQRGLTIDDAADVEFQRGMGLQGQWRGHDVSLGNTRLLDEQQIDIATADTEPSTYALLAIDGQHVGTLVLADHIRADAKGAVQLLSQQTNGTIVMLTGDNPVVANNVGQQVGIHLVQAELLPQDKIAAVRELQTTGATVMVGDGINDAPALTEAQVGFAMGDASALSLEAADVVVVSPLLTRIPQTIALAKATRRKLWQNIALALGIKGAILIITALGYGSMWLAVGADVGASLIVVANGMTLLHVNLPNPTCCHHDHH